MPKFFKSKKGHNSEKKMHFDLSPLIVRIALLIVNTFSEFQLNIFCNNRYYNMLTFLHDKDDAKALAIPRVFSENSSAKNASMHDFHIKIHLNYT